jgi:hypothetical protein
MSATFTSRIGNFLSSKKTALAWASELARSSYVFGLVALFALFFRSPVLFINPRFWAEEGTLYTATAWESGSDVLFTVFKGNYQLLTNISAFLASLVPYSFSPFVTTYISLLILLLTLTVFSTALSGRNVARWKIMVFVLIISLLPGGYEIYLNATNIQWVVALSFLAILAIKEEQLNPKLAYPWALICGLTGVPTCILCPVFLVYGFAVRSKRHLCIGAILLVCTVFQVLIIITFGVSGRSFELSPTVPLFSLFLQTFDAPLLGYKLTSALADWLKTVTSHDLILICVALVDIAIVSGTAMLLDDKKLSVTVSASWFFVTFVQVFGALGVTTHLISASAGARHFQFGVLGDTTHLISASAAARYFQYGACCFCFLACLGTSATNSLRRKISTVLLLSLLFSCLMGTLNNSWANLMLNGPSWNKGLSDCKKFPCSVPIWPDGWNIVIPKKK